MNPSLLAGYTLNIASLGASILLARGSVPGLDRQAAVIASLAVMLLLFPAGIAVLRGGARAQVPLRKRLAIAVGSLDMLLAAGALCGLLLFLFADAQVLSG